LYICGSQWHKYPATAGAELFLAAALGHHRQQSGFEHPCLPIAQKLSAKIFLKYTDKLDSLAMIVILKVFVRHDS
jgi:hypothetical protein